MFGILKRSLKIPQNSETLSESLPMRRRSGSGLSREKNGTSHPGSSLYLSAGCQKRRITHRIRGSDFPFTIRLGPFIPVSACLPYVPYTNTYVGRYSCVGKQLALLEMHTVIARIALDFDITFAPGEMGESFDLGAKDTFTYTVGPLWLVFRERERTHLELIH
jgi:hypothetical protein